MTRFQRLSALLERLRLGMGMTVLELAEELGSDRRTIQRDLRYLTSCGHPVGRTRNKHRRYFLHSQPQPAESRPFLWCLGADFLPELGRALLERRRLVGPELLSSFGARVAEASFLGTGSTSANIVL